MMSIEQFKKSDTPISLSAFEEQRLAATARIVNLALISKSRSGATAARLLFSVNNGLSFNVSDLIRLDSSNRRAANIILQCVQPHSVNIIDWLDIGGYSGSCAYWAVRDCWSELYASLCEADRLIEV